MPVRGVVMSAYSHFQAVDNSIIVGVSNHIEQSLNPILKSYPSHFHDGIQLGNLMFYSYIRHDSLTSHADALHLPVDVTLVTLQGSGLVVFVKTERIVLRVVPVADAPRRLELALTRVKGCDAGRLDRRGRCTFVDTLTSCFNIFETEQAVVFC